MNEALSVDSRALRRVIFGTFAVSNLLYFAFRLAFTLEGATPVWRELFLLAELHLFVSSLAFYSFLGPPSPAPAEWPGRPDGDVDVLLTTYREPLDVVRRSITAALAIRGRRAVLVCDDGRREELRALATTLGARYVTRADNVGFKAGNLNHALQETDAAFVVLCDADHELHPAFLERTLGPLVDPHVAFVQAPQVYRNVDGFRMLLDRSGTRLWHDSLGFQHRLQATAGRLGFALCVGTGVVFRRSALDAIGGFATESVTEDVLTGLRLHARGFLSRSVNEVLGTLLAPETAQAWMRQRLRWAQGAMQILRCENPLFMQGLPIRARLFYLQCLLGFAAAVPGALLVAAPALFLLFDLLPVGTASPIVVAAVVVRVGIDVTTHGLLGAPHVSTSAASVFRLLWVPVQLRALVRFAFPRGLAFDPTPKGAQRAFPFTLVATCLVAAGLNVAAVGSLFRAGARPDGGRLLAAAFCAWFALDAMRGLGWVLRFRTSSGHYRVARPEADGDRGVSFERLGEPGPAPLGLIEPLTSTPLTASQLCDGAARLLRYGVGPPPARPRE